jgi:hypothetical protein
MYDIHEEYTRLNSYYAFERGNGIWQTDKKPRYKHDYGPEVRDNEYYARKYADIFMHIVSQIERMELTFDSRREEDKA